MENNVKEKNNSKGVIMLLCIIIVILLVLCTLFATNTISLSNNNESNEQTNNSNNNESDQNKKAFNIGITNFYFDSVAIVNNGDVYVNVYGSTQEIDNLFGEGTYQTLVSTRNNYKEYTFNNFEYNKQNSNFKGMKLNTNNVSKVYSYESGQSIKNNYGLILLNNDNTISVISLYSLINGVTDVKTIQDLSDIDSIVSENNGGMITYAIQKNGQRIDLSNYIPNDYNQF